MTTRNSGKAVRYTFVITLVLLIHFARIPDVQAQVIFLDKFESYSLSGWTPSGNKTAQVVNSPVRSGNYAAVITLNRSTDKVSYRSELRAKGNLKVGQEYSIEFSQLLPDSWSSDKTPDTIFQLHGVPDSGEPQNNRAPIVALLTHNGSWKLNNAADPNPITTSRSKLIRTSYSLGAHSTNGWTDWVFRIKLSYEEDGVLEVWKNGNKVVSQTGPNTFNDQKGPFLKIGIYKPAWKSGKSWGAKSTAETRALHFDEVRISQ